MATITIREEDKDSVQENRILTAMVISETFLKEIRHIWNHEILNDPIIALIGSWCLDYYQKYEKAPGRNLRHIYDDSIGTILNDEASIEFVKKFLIKISREYENGTTLNEAYLLDSAEKYLQKKAVKKLAEQISELANEDPKKAEVAIAKYKLPHRLISNGMNPFTSKELLDQAYSEESEMLFTFPGAMGELLNHQLTRDSFIGFMAPEKRGKTFWLIEMLMRALRARCHVAFFSIGDMTERQIKRRLDSYLMKRNWRYNNSTTKKILDHYFPVIDCWLNQTDQCSRKERRGNNNGHILGSSGEMPSPFDIKKHTPCHFCIENFKPTYWFRKYDRGEPYVKEDAWESGLKFSKVISENAFKLLAYPNRTVNVSDLDDQFDVWEYQDNFIVDVVIIDYADNLAPEKGSNEFRHQQNILWQTMRALSMKRHCLVITATQSDAQSYNAKIMSLKHFSEDKRKYAHVTAMYGLNQNDEEKVNGILRINPVLVREDDFDRMGQVAVLQNLSIGRPFMGSFWHRSYEDILRELGDHHN